MVGRDVPERHLVEQVARGGEAAGGSVEQHERVGGMGRRGEEEDAAEELRVEPSAVGRQLRRWRRGSRRGSGGSG